MLSCHRMDVEAREQLVRVSSLLPPRILGIKLRWSGLTEHTVDGPAISLGHTDLIFNEINGGVVEFIFKVNPICFGPK